MVQIYQLCTRPTTFEEDREGISLGFGQVDEHWRIESKGPFLFARVTSVVNIHKLI